MPRSLPPRRQPAPTSSKRCSVPPGALLTPLPAPHPGCSVAVRASMPAGPQGNPQVRASAVPGPEEDREVAHAAFMSAYGQSHHGPRIKGMQEFAGAVSWGCVGRAGDCRRSADGGARFGGSWRWQAVKPHSRSLVAHPAGPSLPRTSAPKLSAGD